MNNNVNMSRQTISFNASRTAVGFIQLCIGGFLALVFLVGGIYSIQNNDNKIKYSLLLIVIGLFIGVLIIWYWREWLDRTITLSIVESNLIVEERKRDLLKHRKEFSKGQIKSVFTTVNWGHGPRYKVWLKLRDSKDVFLVDTWYSQSDAIDIRHFVATHLDASEETKHIDRLFG